MSTADGETSEDRDLDVQDSTPNANSPSGAAGGMGVSSERVGHAGPGQTSTDGVRDTSPAPPPDDAPTLPEQSAGGPEPKPEGVEPKAGYPRADPRSE